jgi:hypothetical protein
MKRKALLALLAVAIVSACGEENDLAKVKENCTIYLSRALLPGSITTKVTVDGKAISKTVKKIEQKPDARLDPKKVAPVCDCIIGKLEANKSLSDKDRKSVYEMFAFRDNLKKAEKKAAQLGKDFPGTVAAKVALNACLKHK